MTANRNTISWTPPAQADLEDIMRLSGDPSKTSAVNKAVRFYARALRAQDNGGAVLIQASEKAAARQIEFL
jgi:hypothetical protein